MKILQTPARFYPYVGGVENYVYYLSKELIKSGHEVKIICANEPKYTIEEINNIRQKRLGFIGKIANTNITPSLPFRILNEDFDVLHTHLPTPWSADWSALISAAKKKPLVLTYHNDIVGKGLARHIAKVYNLTALRFLLKKAKKIIVSRSNYIESSPYLKKYKEKIDVVPAGVDIEKFSPGGTEVNNSIFFLSLLDKFHRYKGLDDLLNAMVLIKKEIPAVKLKIGGAGELLEYYKNKTNYLGLHKNVDFLGQVPDEKITEHYRNCSLFVLPSISSSQEGFGMVLLEAMACCKPVVSTNIVGVAEDIRKYGTGMVVEPGDTKALADAAVRILSDEKEAKIMGKRGRRLVEEKYTWKHVCKAMEEIYLDVV